MYCLLSVSPVLEDTCAFRLLVPLSRFRPRRSFAWLTSHPPSLALADVFLFPLPPHRLFIPFLSPFSPRLIFYVLNYTVTSSLPFTCLSRFLTAAYVLFYLYPHFSAYFQGHLLVDLQSLVHLR